MAYFGCFRPTKPYLNTTHLIIAANHAKLFTAIKAVLKAKEVQPSAGKVYLKKWLLSVIVIQQRDAIIR